MRFAREIAQAAHLARLVFVEKKWSWHYGDVPSEADIALWLADRVDRMLAENIEVSRSGHFRIICETDELGETALYITLELATTTVVLTTEDSPF